MKIMPKILPKVMPKEVLPDGAAPPVSIPVEGQPLEDHPSWTLVDNVQGGDSHFGWAEYGNIIRALPNAGVAEVQNLAFKGYRGTICILGGSYLIEPVATDNYCLPFAKFVDGHNLIGVRGVAGEVQIVQRSGGTWTTLGTAVASAVGVWRVLITSVAISVHIDGSLILEVLHSIADEGSFGISGHKWTDGEVDLLREYAYQPYYEMTTPCMTGPDTPYGVASASSEYSPDWVAWKGMDCSSPSAWSSETDIDPTNNPVWIQWFFSAAIPMRPTQLELTPRSGMPSNWYNKYNPQGLVLYGIRPDMSLVEVWRHETISDWNNAGTRSWPIAWSGEAFVGVRLEITKTNDFENTGLMHTAIGHWQVSGAYSELPLLLHMECNNELELVEGEGSITFRRSRVKTVLRNGVPELVPPNFPGYDEATGGVVIDPYYVGLINSSFVDLNDAPTGDESVFVGWNTDADPAYVELVQETTDVPGGGVLHTACKFTSLDITQAEVLFYLQTAFEGPAASTYHISTWCKGTVTIQAQVYVKDADGNILGYWDGTQWVMDGTSDYHTAGAIDSASWYRFESHIAEPPEGANVVFGGLKFIDLVAGNSWLMTGLMFTEHCVPCYIAPQSDGTPGSPAADTLAIQMDGNVDITKGTLVLEMQLNFEKEFIDKSIVLVGLGDPYASTFYIHATAQDLSMYDGVTICSIDDTLFGGAETLMARWSADNAIQAAKGSQSPDWVAEPFDGDLWVQADSDGFIHMGGGPGYQWVLKSLRIYADDITR